MKAKLIGWTAAGLAGVGVFAGVANAAVDSATSPPSTPPSTSSTASPANPHVSAKLITRIERRLMAGAARGEVVLDTKKGVQTVDFQRGTTSDATSGGVTVTDKTGTAENWTVGATTKIRERGTPSPQLADGQHVVVVGVKTDGALTARLILVVHAKATAPASAQPTT